MGTRLTNSLFIEKASKRWGNKYNYSKTEYIGGLKPIIVICPEHGEFSIKPQWHLQDSYCPECQKLNRKSFMEKFNKETKKMSNETWIQKAKEIHGEKFDYSKTNYIGATHKITIICPKHGEHSMLPQHHTKGHGCPECGKAMINISNGNQLTQEQFIERVKLVDDYGVDKLDYVGKRKEVILTCKHHGDFTTTGELILKGHGCPDCFIRSSGEVIISKVLLKNNVEFQKEKRYSDLKFKSRLRFDFYLPKYNACIEFDGKQHFVSVEHWGGDLKYQELKIKDMMKNEYCQKNNMQLLRIPYWEKNVEEKVINFLQRLKE